MRTRWSLRAVHDQPCSASRATRPQLRLLSLHGLEADGRARDHGDRGGGPGATTKDADKPGGPGAGGPRLREHRGVLAGYA